MIFEDRKDAGEKLSEKLQNYKKDNAVVLALPRGGVPVGKVVADRLGLPMGLIVVRKIGHQYNPEYAVAAVSEDGILVKNEREASGLDPVWFESAKRKELREAKRRRRKYWGDRNFIDLKGKKAIIVDDGLATGLTMEAAIAQARSRGAEKVVVAVPVAPVDIGFKMKNLADEFIVVSKEQFFTAVGAFYKKFDQISDEEVIRALQD